MSATGTSHHRRAFAALCLATLGVVYGDIGTSPLYTVSEIFFGPNAISYTPQNALGATSLVLWILTLSVTLKYILLVLRANHEGQGGTFALLALIQRAMSPSPNAERRPIGTPLLGGLGFTLVLAAGLLFGEGIITPAISVLSAVEGLKIATTAFEPVVVPATAAVLIVLFSIQRHGTARIGGAFGPVLAIWFIVIAGLGVVHVIAHPGILGAIDPRIAVRFLVLNGLPGSVAVLGSVLLAVTGCEALFADLGHFGARPIRVTWFSLVYPALLLNYLGQGAYVFGGGPVEGGHLFYALAPRWALLPLVGLATFATVIASQALISGAFSLTRQAIAFGLFPRLQIVHTSGTHEGQIYVPVINRALLVSCVFLVLSFGSSSRLAAAYGFAVSGVMLVTSIAMMTIAIRVWGWRWYLAVPLFGFFAAIEAIFFSSSSLKILHGAWLPLAIGILVFGVMTTWQWGRQRVAGVYSELAPHCETVRRLLELKQHPSIPQLPRSIVVMASKPVLDLDDRIPPALHLFWTRLGALPKHIVLLTVRQLPVPYAHLADAARNRATTFLADPRFGTVVSLQSTYGYMETPDVRRSLVDAKELKSIRVPGDPRRWLVLVGNENVTETQVGLLVRLRLSFFRAMLRNSVPAHLYFGLGADSFVTSETVHLAAAAFDGDGLGPLPEAPESEV
jgi:KUP system potassium uptake protein